MKLLASLLIAIFLCLGALATTTAYLPTLDSLDSTLEADPDIVLTLAAPAGIQKSDKGQPILDAKGHKQILVDPKKTSSIDRQMIDHLRKAGVFRVQILEFALGRWSLSWLFLLSVIGITGGGLMIKKQTQQEVAAFAEAAVNEGLSVEQTMDEVQGWLGELAREVLDDPDEVQANTRITRKLDELGKNQLAKVLESRAVLQNRFGLAGFAEFMSLYSILERRIHRAWSAAADGVHEEAVECLAQAVQEAREVQDWLGARV